MRSGRAWVYKPNRAVAPVGRAQAAINLGVTRLPAAAHPAHLAAHAFSAAAGTPVGAVAHVVAGAALRLGASDFVGVRGSLIAPVGGFWPEVRACRRTPNSTTSRKIDRP